MRILFASGMAHVPQVFGGVEINTHELALELLSRRHEVVVLSKLSYRTLFGIRKEIARITRRKSTARDDSLGYPVFRARRPWRDVEEVLKLFHPDIVVIQNGRRLQMASAFISRGYPTMIYLHDLGFESWAKDDPVGDPTRLPNVGYFANSDFTARRFHQRYGLASCVIPPIFRAEQYATPTNRANVTFINPAPEKGVDLALAIAERCPQIPFRIVKGWPLGISGLMRLRKRLSSLPNVELVERTVDMRAIYAQARIVLVPSQWEETWGRVATEAQFSGIPVVTSDRGSLPETIGPGGVVVPAKAPAGTWADVLDKLWRDEKYYNEKAQAALNHSRRPTLDLSTQVDTFMNRITEHLESVHRD